MRNQLYFRLLLKLKLSQIARQNAATQTHGFTLIELLVVIMIVGILAAIAMPNFLNQAVKARQSEAKQSLGLVNRGQASYRTEFSTFSNSFDRLAVGVGLVGNTTAQTGNYGYTLDSTTDPQTKATIIAQPVDAAAKSYTGGNLRYVNVQNQAVGGSIICESKSPSTGVPPIILFPGNAALECPDADYQQITTKVGN
jgi:type IV pilus assembly protein PilA